jgi:hypothetical protein
MLDAVTEAMRPYRGKWQFLIEPRKPMEIHIKSIPHGEQRYPTCGDWQFEANGDLTIRVSKLSDWRREALIAVHELVEVLLCKNDGVTEQAVDEFDMEYEKNRAADDIDSEPGMDPKAPYHRQHRRADVIERSLAIDLGVDWEKYADEICALL